MKSTPSLLTCAALLAGAISANAATVVNVSFGPNKTEANLDGPAGGSGESWNQNAGGITATNIKDSAGAATTIDWAFNGGFSGSGNWNSATTIDMLESALFRSDATSRTLTISDLDITKKYNLYIASFDQNSWGNAEMSFTTTNTTTTVGAQVASNTLGSPWTLNNNYVLFEELVPNASSQIAIAGVKITGDHGMWNGFQLVEIAPVPEPSAALLGALGLLTLLRRRRA